MEQGNSLMLELNKFEVKKPSLDSLRKFAPDSLQSTRFVKRTNFRSLYRQRGIRKIVLSCGAENMRSVNCGVEYQVPGSGGSL